MIIEKKDMCVEKWFKDLLILQYVGSNFNLKINCKNNKENNFTVTVN